MDTPRDANSITDTTYATVSFLSSQGVAIEAPVTHLTRHLVVFGLHNPEELLRVSEA